MSGPRGPAAGRWCDRAHERRGYGHYAVRIGYYTLRLDEDEEIGADSVIVATPAFRAADLLATLDPNLAGDLAAIPHASTAIVTLAYRRDEIPPLAPRAWLRCAARRREPHSGLHLVLA